MIETVTVADTVKPPITCRVSIEFEHVRVIVFRIGFKPMLAVYSHLYMNYGTSACCRAFPIATSAPGLWSIAAHRWGWM